MQWANIAFDSFKIWLRSLVWDVTREGEREGRKKSVLDEKKMDRSGRVGEGESGGEIQKENRRGKKRCVCVLKCTVNLSENFDPCN